MYELVSFVARGKIRKQILPLLTSPHTPTEIANLIQNQRSTTSRTILALEKKGLVICLTPNEKMGRFYQISAEGKKVLDILGSE